MVSCCYSLPKLTSVQRDLRDVHPTKSGKEMKQLLRVDAEGVADPRHDDQYDHQKLRGALSFFESHIDYQRVFWLESVLLV